MRQIKFRAQDIAGNEGWDGDLRHHKGDVCSFEQGGTKGFEKFSMWGLLRAKDI